MPFPSGSFRGGLEINDTLFAAFTDELYTISSDGTVAFFDSLAGTDQIFIARNNAATPDIVIVCNAGPFEFQASASSISSYADGDVGSPSCMCFHDGYFMFGYGNGDILASGLQDTAINTLDSANAASNPDGVSSLWSYQGNLYVAGETTIEVWGYPVNTAGFPLTRQGYHITPGLITPNAVAGWQPEFGYPPIYVGKDNTVRVIDGLQAKKISPPDLDRLIDQLEDKTELEACVYRASGYAFWQLSCNSWTWVYCIGSDGGRWHERISYLSDRSRFTGGSLYAFNQWLTGDTDEANLFAISISEQQEAGDPLIASIDSSSVKNFPNRTRVARADFDFVTGVGIATGSDPDQTDPSVLVSWSDDGGYTYSDPYTRKLGRQANTQQRVMVFNTGMSGPMGRKWRLQVSDAVDFALLGGDMSAELRTK